MAGWASTAWATIWGGGLPSPTAISARMVASNVVRARLTMAPRAVHRSRYDDALNPANWAVLLADGSTPPRVLRVEPVSTPSPASVPAGALLVTADAGTEFDLVLSAPVRADLGVDVQAPGVRRA